MITADEKRPSQGDLLRRRADARAVVPPIVGFIVSFAAAIAFAPNGGNNGWRTLLWFLPMIFVFWVVAAQVTCFRRADEYQQRVQLAALAVGFAATMVTAIFCQLIESAPIHVKSGAYSPAGLVILAGILGWNGTMLVKSRQGSE